MSDNDKGKMLDAHIARSTVGILKTSKDSVGVLGSATLVRTSTTQGLLTCGHVFKELEKLERFGVCQFPVRSDRLQKLIFKVRDTVSLGISLYEKEGDAPDIAFIPIPSPDFSSLKSSSNVFDLDLGRDRYLSATVSNFGINVVAGIIEEMTKPAADTGSRKILSVKGLINVGGARISDPENGFDIVHMSPEAAPDGSLPESFGGTSGGGLWEIFVDGTTEEFLEKRLAGVAYKETFEDGHLIKCHGPKSIYEILLGKIYDQFRR